ncbi:MAG: hypothetical protein QHJ73_02425 [Armatimonadota bacterium]|nr:hypothetical protein [Armatimonadota bacterium]
MDQNEIARHLSRAAGSLALEWRYQGVTWRVSIAHTHGDVVALAVWSSELGYLAYREHLAHEFLTRLGLLPRPTLGQRLWQAVERVRRWLPGG